MKNLALCFALIFCQILLVGCGADGIGDSESGSTNNDNEAHQSPDSHNHDPVGATTEGAVIAVKTGNWSDASVWPNQQLPKTGDSIVIPKGLAVTVDTQLTENYRNILVKGSLNFATNVNTELRVDTLESDHEGSLAIGSEADPVDANVTAQIVFSDFGDIDRTKDPKQLSRGAVLRGPVSVWGASKTSWLALASDALQGDTQLALASEPNGWKVGDRLVIAATEKNEPTSDEVVTIQSIDGATVTITGAVVRNHVSAAPGLQVHIANLTRNVIFSSASASLSRRGHVMFMHNSNVSINYARFYQIGRTDKTKPLDDMTFPELDDAPPIMLEGNNMRGRYAIHFHRGGVGANSIAAVVNGSVVEDNPGWAYVNHSSNVNFIDNVSYNVVGGAFQTEAGDEKGSFVRNIALRTVHPNDPLNCNCEEELVDVREDRQDFAFQGDGFWLHGTDLTVEDNVVAGATGHAFIYWPEGLVELIGDKFGMARIDASRFPNNHLLTTTGTIDTWYFPVKSFKNNVGYSATKGLEIYYLHAHEFFTGNQDPVTEEYVSSLNSTFDGITFWNMKQHGIGLNYVTRSTFKNIRLVGNGENDVGIDGDHFHNLNKLTFENLNIENFAVGFDVPTQGTVTVNGAQLNNRVDFRIENPQMASRELVFRNIQFSGSTPADDSGRTYFQMAPDFSFSGEVQDGLERGEGSKHPYFFIFPDRITLDFGTYAGKTLYFDQQVPSFDPTAGLRSDTTFNEYQSVLGPYLGKDNQTLNSEFGLSFGGAFIPDGAESLIGIVGGKVGTTAPAVTIYPPEVELD